jgi:hypothetical protein
MIATLIDTPVAPGGIVQFPFVPHTATLYVSSEPIGVARGPMVSEARVSNNRHGVIGTNDDAAVDPAAEAVNNWPPPNNVTTTAPTAAQRARLPTSPNIRHSHPLTVPHEPRPA